MSSAQLAKEERRRAAQLAEWPSDTWGGQTQYLDADAALVAFDPLPNLVGWVGVGEQPLKSRGRNGLHSFHSIADRFQITRFSQPSKTNSPEISGREPVSIFILRRSRRTLLQ